MNKDFFKKIVVAVNGSEAAIQAAMYGIMMARCYNLKIKAVYVVDTATIKYLSANRFLIAEEQRNFEEKLKADGTRYLKYVERLAQSKGVKIETELLSGGVYSEIVKACDKFEADLLLLGGNVNTNLNSKTRNAVSSSEQEMIASSKVPVLVVKKPEIEKLFKTV